jgi:16S rRNA (cytidine1402-2'-O)-methyltransferase
MIRQWYNTKPLKSQVSVHTAGTLFVVATPIGNLEDVTLRALRVLREVALIAAEDTRRTAHLLARHGIATRMTSLHEHNEAAKAPALVARLLAGDSIAVVSDAGTPAVSDPGQLVIAAAIAAGVRVEPVPGPSAILAALAASGLAFDAFAFLGFPPIRARTRRAWFERAKAIGGIVVFFEAPHRIERTLRDLQQAVGDCEVVIARELTKIHAELVKRPISDLLTDGIKPQGEFTVVAIIGHTTDSTPSEAPRPDDILREFGEITNSERCSRRQAVKQLAKRHRMSPNAVYELIERGRKSVD